MAGDLTPHFSVAEFRCRCGCGLGAIDLDFVRRLERARCVAGVPFHITSGVRCPAHNRQVKEAGAKSAHVQGRAADIFVLNNQTRWAILCGVFTAGFRRVEIGPVHIHVDTADDADHRQDVCWLA